MSCTSPQCYIQSPNGGKLKHCMDDYPPGPSPLGKVVYLPCGHCLSCLISRRQELTLLQCCEASLHQENWFVTLTYEDQATFDRDGIFPYSLNRSDLSEFVESMRKYCSYRGKSFRFFACGEYGEKYERPHFHLSIFGLSSDDLGIADDSDVTIARKDWIQNGKLKPLKPSSVDSNGNCFWNSTVISSRWKIGSHKIYRATRETFQYVAGYQTKKFLGKDRAYWKSTGRKEPFVLQSRPSIGYPWFSKYCETVSVPNKERLINDVLEIADIKWSIPRIFFRWLERFDHFDGPRSVQLIKELREKMFPHDVPDRVDLKRKADYLKYRASQYQINNTHKEV